jgi:ubiquinone/menaquinone biosynthesis C-methylase UbiE
MQLANISNRSENETCILCGATSLVTFLVGKDYRYKTSENEFRLVQCQRCGLVSLSPLPTKAEVARMYPDPYYQNGSDLCRALLQPLMGGDIASITRLRQRGRILDVGCGDGSFLLQFKKRNWETFGVEISETSCSMASAKVGRNIFNSELADCHFPNEYFDMITFNHVLEHIREPNEVLKEAHRILRKDGFVRISVPNIASAQFIASEKFWLHLDLPRHVYHYSPKTLELILSKNGFRIYTLKRPLTPFPLDLFRSLERKFLRRKHRAVRLVGSIPLLSISSLKLVPSWRATLQVIASKEDT